MTERNIEQQFAELPLELKKYALHLSADNFGIAEDFSKNISGALAYMVSKELEAAESHLSPYQEDIMLNLSLHVNDLNELIQHGKHELKKKV